MEVSDNPSLRKDTSDPTLICTAYKKNRFYLFTRKEPEDTKGWGVKGHAVSVDVIQSVLLHSLAPKRLVPQHLVKVGLIPRPSPCRFYKWSETEIGLGNEARLKCSQTTSTAVTMAGLWVGLQEFSKHKRSKNIMFLRIWPLAHFYWVAARCVTKAFCTTCAVHIEYCEGWWLLGGQW